MCDDQERALRELVGAQVAYSAALEACYRAGLDPLTAARAAFERAKVAAVPALADRPAAPLARSA